MRRAYAYPDRAGTRCCRALPAPSTGRSVDVRARIIPGNRRADARTSADARTGDCVRAGADTRARTSIRTRHR